MAPPMPVRAALIAAAVALFATSCGDEAPVRSDGRTLRVKLDEFRVLPQNSEVAPGRLRIVATNIGRVPHNLKVVRIDEEDREAPPIEIGGTGTAQPGETATFTFHALEPGEYRVVCTITNHDDLGQYGKLVVDEQEQP